MKSNIPDPKQAIQIENLTVSYGDKIAISDLSLRIPSGQWVLLTGPSGCGKSTLARCLNGLIPHIINARVEGKVVVEGIDTEGSSVAHIATKVGSVFQIPETQLFNRTVEEELSFGPRNLALSNEEIKDKVKFGLEAVGIENYSQELVRELSGGEKQRVVIGATLAMHPDTLILDEPLGSLDRKGTELVLDVLTRLNQEEQITIFIIEHKTSLVAPLADRVLVMDRGKLILDGAPQEVFSEKEKIEELGIRPLELGDREETSHYRQNDDLIVSLEDISFRYGDKPILRDLSLKIAKGDFVALVGDNGAGKSTLAHIILGLLKPDSGRVKVFGRGVKVSFGREIGLLQQNPLEQLFCDTVEEEITFGLNNFGLPLDGRLEEVLSITDLTDMRYERVHSLSSGQQQRLALASILALTPTLLILDEPTLGQDWGHLTKFMDFTKKLNEQGNTILLITHDQELVNRYARNIFKLEEGKIRPL